ncbi:MAG: XrtA/PEP-CTERM system-associated ATPase [Candidatus Competibacterales bacterium]
MYIDYYGYSALPFQLNPDPQFFFNSSCHRRALSYLRYGLSRREGFIVITGGIGMGKTTLVKSLLRELDPATTVAAQLVTTQLDADDLLRMVCASLGLSFENASKASLLNQLEGFLRRCADEGRRALLLVDEAQNLPMSALEELRMLSNFGSDQPFLQSFLLGQVEFRELLAAPSLEQLRQRVIAACHLTPLNALETREYIEHRLGVVGWNGENPIIDPEAFGAVYQRTGGIPRRINLFCDRLLLYGFLEERPSLTLQVVAVVGVELRQQALGGGDGPSPAVGPAPGGLPVDLQQTLDDIHQSIDALMLEPDVNEQRYSDLDRRLRRLEAQLEPPDGEETRAYASTGGKISR